MVIPQLSCYQIHTIKTLLTHQLQKSYQCFHAFSCCPASVPAVLSWGVYKREVLIRRRRLFKNFISKNRYYYKHEAILQTSTKWSSSASSSRRLKHTSSISYSRIFFNRLFFSSSLS